MMGSPGGSSSGGSKGKLSQQQGVTRQSSVYNLTLDEIQNQLGKPFSSMNLDELLKILWTSEGSQPLATDVEGTTAAGSQTNLRYQSALIGTLSKKTVDEVWRNMQQNKDSEEKKSQERQPTLGETTLEDFLVGAGLMFKSSPEKRNAIPASGVYPGIAAQFPPHGQWMQYPTQPQFLHPSPASGVYPGIAAQFPRHGPLMQYLTQPQFLHPSPGMIGGYMPAQALPQQLQMGAGSMMDLQYIESKLALPPPPMGTSSDRQTSERKRGSSADVIDNSVERRQKRMVKNRESAAASRTKKQNYIKELEQEIARLQEEIERLRKRKAFENMFPTSQPPNPRNQLRRTSSAP